MTPLEYALFYAGLGWRVAPIPPGYKYPHKIDDWQHKATNDPVRIKKHWHKHPDHGMCLATGPGSGVIAIDIDSYNGGDDGWRELEAKFGPAPETVEAITGGGGRHLVFRDPPGSGITNGSASYLPHGIDVRGDGGQICIAPTVHPVDEHDQVGTPYMWEVEHDPFSGCQVAELPPWLLDLLTRPPVEQQARRERTPMPPGAEQRPGDWLEYNVPWPELLEPDGANFHSRRAEFGTGEIYELWTRPGKSVRAGASASLGYRSSNVLKVFSSEWPNLLVDATYTKIGYIAATRFGGLDDQAFTKAAAWVGKNLMPETAATTHVGGSDKRTSATAKRPAIVHNGRQLDDVVNQAVTALVADNDPPILFVRAGQLARLRSDEDERPLIEAMRPEHAKNALSAAADWYRTNKDGERTSISPPLEYAIAILAAGDWPLPALAGVVELPVLRPDGTFAVEHGYDEPTKLYHWHHGDPYEEIAEHPTAEQLARAVALIDEMLCDFPWDTSADRANAWGLLLTPLIRPLVGQVPMALVDAPEPGTGKGLLISIAATITMGRSAGLMSWPTSEEELEKKVTSALMAGNTMIIWDNVEGTIKSGTLAAVLTADTWQGRRLGVNEMVSVPNRATWAATGNNVDVGGDLARRCYRIRLDARQAQPWKRSGFRHDDLAGWVADNRGQLLHALCTIVRAWWVDGRKLADGIPAMGGFTGWVRIVGGIIETAGIGDFLGNLAEFHASADVDAQAWEAFLSAWLEGYGEQPMTVRQMIATMADIYVGHRLRDALPEDLAGHWEKPEFAKRLGNQLKKKAGRHYGDDGLHIVISRDDHLKVNVYTVTSRQMTLFPDPIAGLRGSETPSNLEKPAGLRASAGSSTALREENTYPQDEKNIYRSGVSEPAEPRNPASHEEELF